MPRPVTLVTGPCARCCQWHTVPTACTHDVTKPCPQCGAPFGGLIPDMDGTRCWACCDREAIERMRRGGSYLPFHAPAVARDAV
jgi:hypothetical protein